MTDIVLIEVVTRELVEVSGETTTIAQTGEATFTVTVSPDSTILDTSYMVPVIITEGIQGPSGGGGGGMAILNNVISVPTVIATDTSYPIISYLKVLSDLTVNGNLMVIG